jgi:uncharacterized membrane protein YkoI
MKKGLIASVLVAALFGGASAFAASVGGFTLPKQPILLMERAVVLARYYGHGTVIKVELDRRGERYLYKARVATENGEIRRLDIDAHTAELLENKRDD